MKLFCVLHSFILVVNQIDGSSQEFENSQPSTSAAAKNFTKQLASVIPRVSSNPLSPSSKYCRSKDGYETDKDESSENSLRRVASAQSIQEPPIINLIRRCASWSYSSEDLFNQQWPRISGDLFNQHMNQQHSNQRSGPYSPYRPPSPPPSSPVPFTLSFDDSTGVPNSKDSEN